MSNITLAVADDVIRKVRKLAIDRNTTLTAMVRGYLESLAEREESERTRAAQELNGTFAKYSREMGRRTWTREDLHAR